MDQVIIIPARMGGTRLPGKPLISINGKPIIKHVWERCAHVFDETKVYVGTEDIEIADYCTKNKMRCVLTEKAETAIDRIKLVSDIIPAEGYINVQGDEPIINTQDILSILAYNRKFPNRVVFGKVKAEESEFNDYSKAKVVCGKDNRLLYSSRSGIPINNKGKFVGAERAIWIYGFYKEALDSYHFSNENTYLDRIEDNEIIRFLEIDIPVYCIDLIGDSWAVDEYKDIEIVENRLKNNKFRNV